ncbi:hypothetical protein GCM10010174_88260 [Kutzneria viridogrisea]|uniref:8-amino-7-oxononanoate synthase n=2 Tax=Kutzneria viridogrisea TaxID=47990 RepID=A0ABR6BXM8_9PSEU|nr:7-keto-8-aminopelargonate synthetase-like enzyme [Kutzneria viridogrisea]
MLCQSGWAANVGLIQAVAAPGSPVYVDVTAHASLLARVHAAEAVARPFAHNDFEHLERTIGKHGPGLIAFDTLYSVTGDLCPLVEYVDLAEWTGCALIADESHALGVLGPSGAGLVAELGLILVADDRRSRRARNALVLRDGLTGLGYNIAPSGSQIIPLQPGSEQALCLLQRLLDAQGVFGAPFVPLAVPANRCAQRLSVHSELTESDLQRVLDACAAVRDEAGLRTWKSTRRLVAA